MTKATAVDTPEPNKPIAEDAELLDALPRLAINLSEALTCCYSTHSRSLGSAST